MATAVTSVLGRRMFDAVTASRIPASASIVGGYVDGLYRWSTVDWARFPHAVKVRIAVFHSTNDGHVLDCEPGNCTPAESVDWVLMRRRAGVDPTVYCNQMDPDTGWPAVRAAFHARLVPEPHYWVAKYDGLAVIPPGAIAKQYLENKIAGYDLSIVADHLPGIDPPLIPAPVPAPVIPEADMPPLIIHVEGTPEVWALHGARYWHVTNPTAVNAYKGAGAREVVIPQAEHAAILAAGPHA